MTQATAAITTPGSHDAPDVLTDRKTSGGRILLPWQEAWRADESRLKIWEKSRRIGATYTEANDVVMDRLTGRTAHYWFSSADESAAYEFADYCRFWLKVAGKVVEVATEFVRDDLTGRDAKAFVVKFPNGSRMTAMSSNPRRFRSKGGDVGLDEFAFHDDPQKMWDAAYPTITWGDRLRVLSTHNGEGSLFHRMIQMGQRHQAGEARKRDMPFSLHRITIVEAVEQGLVEKINEVKGTSLTRDEFIEQCRAGCRNEDQWLQEFMAIPSKDASAWLTYQLIEQCEDDDAGKPDLFGDGPRYLGADIGEVKDPTAIWWGELVGDVLWVRERVRLVGAPLADIEREILSRLNHPKTVRGCIDGTGLGTQIGQAAERTGKGESIKFTIASKDEIASPLRGRFEDRSIRVPSVPEVREDLHSIRMTMAAGHPRFDAARSELGHADEFWACGLMSHAAKFTARGAFFFGPGDGEGVQ